MNNERYIKTGAAVDIWRNDKLEKCTLRTSQTRCKGVICQYFVVLTGRCCFFMTNTPSRNNLCTYNIAIKKIALDGITNVMCEMR